MESIRDHKNVVAGVIGLMGFVANFTPIPGWAQWAAFGLFLVAAAYLLIDAYRVRMIVMTEVTKRNPNAESELTETAVTAFVVTDIVSGGH